MQTGRSAPGRGVAGRRPSSTDLFGTPPDRTDGAYMLLATARPGEALSTMLRSTFAIVGFIACAALPVPGVGAAAKCDPAAFRVVVDVGHTAEVPGAISARGVPEYAFNLRLAQTIDKHLAAAGLWPAALESFRRGLRDLGWIEGRNVVVEYRWAEGRFDRLHEIADELVRLKVDIIVAPSSIYTEAARRATSTIPIIFASHADPIGSNHVASVRRPGGNITGLSLLMSDTNSRSS